MTISLKPKYTIKYPLTAQEKKDNEAIILDGLSRIIPPAEDKIWESGFSPREAIVNFLEWKEGRKSRMVDLSRDVSLSRVIDRPIFTFVVDFESGEIVDVHKN